MGAIHHRARAVSRLRVVPLRQYQRLVMTCLVHVGQTQVHKTRQAVFYLAIRHIKTVRIVEHAYTAAHLQRHRQIQIHPTPEPIPEPVPEPIPEPTPEPIPEPVPEPIPEPIPEAIPEPVPEPISEPVPEPTPEPIPEPTPEAVPEPAPAPAKKICPRCGTELDPAYRFCLECGTPV